MKTLILLMGLLFGGLSASAQWAEDFDGKTTLDLQTECWALHNTEAYTHNGLSCGLTASTSIIAADVNALAPSDSMTLTTPAFIDSGTVFFDYTANLPSKVFIYAKVLNRNGTVSYIDTLSVDTTLQGAVLDVGPANRIQLLFVWLGASTGNDTIYIDDVISTVDTRGCSVFAIEAPEPDEPLDKPIVAPTYVSYFNMSGKSIQVPPMHTLFVRKETYMSSSFYDQKFIKTYILR